MRGLLLLTSALFASIPEFLCLVTTEPELAVLEGKSLIIPCHYEPQYAGYVKYWCHGKTRDFCDTLARTDDPLPTNPRVSIADDPAQEVFTVTMTDLKEGDSGSYMCGVEIGGVWHRDVTAFTSINVIHGMLVLHSRVSGEEGDSVTVQCFYSERYRESEKKWCRSGDWSSCQQTGSEGRYEDVSVAIVDDRNQSFTVTVKRLRMKDTGWYWCGAGQQKKAIHVLVTPRLPTTPRVTSLPPDTFAATSSQRLEQGGLRRAIEPFQKHESAGVFHPVWFSMVVCLSVVLVLILALLMRKQRNLHTYDSVLRDGTIVSRPLHECSGKSGDVQKSGTIIFCQASQDVHMC